MIVSPNIGAANEVTDVAQNRSAQGKQPREGGLFAALFKQIASTLGDKVTDQKGDAGPAETPSPMRRQANLVDGEKRGRPMHRHHGAMRDLDALDPLPKDAPPASTAVVTTSDATGMSAVDASPQLHLFPVPDVPTMPFPAAEAGEHAADAARTMPAPTGDKGLAAAGKQPLPANVAGTVARAETSSPREVEARQVRWVSHAPLGRAAAHVEKSPIEPGAAQRLPVTPTPPDYIDPPLSSQPVVIEVTERRTHLQVEKRALTATQGANPDMAKPPTQAASADADAGEEGEQRLAAPVPDAPLADEDRPETPPARLNFRAIGKDDHQSLPQVSTPATPPALGTNGQITPPASALPSLVVQTISSALPSAPAAATPHPGVATSAPLDVAAPAAVQTMSVTLDTVEHGSLDIRMSISGSTLTLHFRAERAETAEHLRREEAALGSLLRDHGYETSAVRVETRHAVTATSDVPRADTQAGNGGAPGGGFAEQGAGRQPASTTPQNGRPEQAQGFDGPTTPNTDSNAQVPANHGAGGLYV